MPRITPPSAPISTRAKLAWLMLAWLGLLLMPGLPRAESPPLMLAEIYREDVNPADYWVSEKLDGVRAYWDGNRLLFRSGHTIQAPDWFTRELPRTALDGELWMERGQFEKLSATVRRQQPMDAEWREVRYLLFELPQAEGTFTQRLEKLQQIVKSTPRAPWLGMIEQIRILSPDALRKKLNTVVSAGGEGLMLHRADAPFRSGRTEDLLKLKPYLDQEATVIEHIPGKGRLTGRMGSLLVETDEGRRFRLGTGFSDEQRLHPPPIGSRVTYQYRGLTAKGLPRFASFLRIREAD